MNKNEQIFHIADRCLQKIRKENPDDALLVSYIGDAINEAFDKIPSAKETLTESQFHTVWTEAAFQEGYNKKLFQSVFNSLKLKHKIV